MPWRRDREQLIADAAGELAPLFGADLRTLVVYGSAVGSAVGSGAARAGVHSAGSDVNLAVVAEPLTFAHLQRVAQWWARWRREGFAAPLLLSGGDLARSRDVFPLELLDIQARHRTLAGRELFADLTLAADAVRLECEREAKGKLVRLRELYLELAGSRRDLRALMRDARKSFLAVMRGLLFVAGEGWCEAEPAVVAAFERLHGRRFPMLAALATAGEDAPLEERFAEYIAEAEALAVIADRSSP